MMKVPADYKPKDNNTGATLLTTAKTYAYTSPKPFINITQADYILWRKADLWTIERAILLLLNKKTLPSISTSYGVCKSTAQQLIYDDFIKIWAIAEISLKAGVLKKIGNDYPSLLSEVLPGDFIQWAESKGYSLPDGLKAMTTATQTEDVGLDGQDDTLPNERELTHWLRDTWEKEGRPGGTKFFTCLKNYNGIKGSPVTQYYFAGKAAGISWRTSSGATGEMKKATILNKVSIFKKPA